jgi:hypothetical protein
MPSPTPARGEPNVNGRLYGRGAAVAGATVLCLVVTATAFAAVTDNMFPTANTRWGCVDGRQPGANFCQTDNSALTVFRESSLSAAGKANVFNALQRNYQPTDLTVSYPGSPSYTGSNETDIIYRRGSVPSGADGVAWCDDAVSSVKCDQHYVQFRYATPGEALACHETGHAVGLTHGGNASPRLSNTDGRLGCMRTPVSGGLGAQNVEMINGTY